MFPLATLENKKVNMLCKRKEWHALILKFLQILQPCGRQGPIVGSSSPVPVGSDHRLDTAWGGQEDWVILYSYRTCWAEISMCRKENVGLSDVSLSMCTRIQKSCTVELKNHDPWSQLPLPLVLLNCGPWQCWTPVSCIGVRPLNVCQRWGFPQQ